MPKSNSEHTLRIVGGTHSGRRIPVPEVEGLRPTSERAREAIASALSARGRIQGASVLELFSGTGAFSFEMASRGAQFVVAIERQHVLAEQINALAAALQLPVQARAGDGWNVGRIPVGESLFDLVFLDPPYDQSSRVPRLLADLTASDLLDPGVLIVLEIRTKDARSFTNWPDSLVELKRYRYGEATMVLLEREQPQEPTGKGTAP